jgi:hypothetical protein
MRLVATDLDGTLLGPGGEVSPRTVAALQATRDAGWYVVLATGRPPFMVDLLMPQLGDAVTHGIMANGSVVATLPDQTVLRSIRFGIDVATGVVDRLRGVDPAYHFALATDIGFAHEPGFAERMPAPTPTPPTTDVLEAAAGATEAVKLMVFHDTLGAHELLGLLPTILGHDVSVTHMGANCVEVGVAGIDKGTGLRFLCDLLHVDAADVVAFGDEYNDHEMLVWAGRGIAMANAPEETRRLADEITLTNLEDGVAVALERILRA